MRVDLTCSQPRRNLVSAIRVLREVLARGGHRVRCHWPVARSFRMDDLQQADVVIHACDASAPPVPDSLSGLTDSGKIVLRYAPGHAAERDAEDEADALLITGAEDALDAIAVAAAESVG